MSQKNKPPRCPLCNAKSAPYAGGNFQCKRCRGIFSDRNEGIVSTHVDPVKAAESKEAFEARLR